MDFGGKNLTKEDDSDVLTDVSKDSSDGFPSDDENSSDFEDEKDDVSATASALLVLVLMSSKNLTKHSSCIGFSWNGLQCIQVRHFIEF